MHLVNSQDLQMKTLFVVIVQNHFENVVLNVTALFASFASFMHFS